MSSFEVLGCVRTSFIANLSFSIDEKIQTNFVTLTFRCLGLAKIVFELKSNEAVFLCFWVLTLDVFLTLMGAKLCRDTPPRLGLSFLLGDTKLL